MLYVHNREYYCVLCFILFDFQTFLLGRGYHCSQAAGQGVPRHWWFGRVHQVLCPTRSWQ